MGRLYMSRVYLSGAMDRVPDGGVQWREELTPWLNSRGIVVFDPCVKPCNVGKEDPISRAYRHQAKLQGNYEPLLVDRPVRAVDLRMVDITDFQICKIDTSVHACGTYEEVFWGNREKKPILVFCEQGKDCAPDWLFWTVPHQLIFDNLEKLKDYLDYVDTAPEDEVETYKRWIFFDLEKVTGAAVKAYNERMRYV